MANTNEPGARQGQQKRWTLPAGSISEKASATIQNQLDQFEAGREYLEKKMTLAHLAGLFDTNTRYVAKVIAVSRQKNVIDYINDLRIDYVVSQLRSQRKYRHYTIGALADDIGFGSTRDFKEAFVKRTGISVRYFLEQLNLDSPVTDPATNPKTT